MKNLTFTVSFTGVIDTTGGDPEAIGIAMTQSQLRTSLEQLANDVLSNGAFTGDTPASLVEHDFTISIGEEQTQPEQAALRQDLFVKKLNSFTLPVTPENLENIKGSFDCGLVDGEGCEVLLDTTSLDASELDQLAKWVNLTADCLIKKRILIYESTAD
ncbi:hypothetical protein QAO71_17070 (plasmid) [Halopseudomonas sp. SMJS2]|uniref:hypothetical protein n=1 Tax=Halopseudomonas sp. SMJS2 TaxID=3041098 RepID=UPI002452A4FC|nr:hypothetical protein [Halopseudomonas sp. SMJS2]WGK63481.1 hypothetical protein QAO71_17070 [Halopseudomonas sp. SMJS2]